MDNLLPLLSTVLPIVALTLLVVVLFLNIYVKIRRKLPISVNCWFCNCWTKVSYDDRNSFDCPTCMQYNGFTRDGDYNKIIPEQHDEMMNRSQRVKTAKSGASNGLCIFCNNNQQLKMFQLANFVPLVEKNYDVEIEHFQEQLERAYKLCKKCDKVLKNTLNKQRSWIFGMKLKNMYNGVSKVTEQIKKDRFFTKLDGFVSVILVCAVILTAMSSIKIFTKTLAAYVPVAYLPIYKNTIAGLNRTRILNFHLQPYFNKSVKIEPYFVVRGLGVMFQVIKMIRGLIRGSTKVNDLLCWIILFLSSWVHFSKNFSSYILLLEAFCCVYLLATAFVAPVKHQPPSNGKSMRKLVKNLENTCTDFSESSDFENVSTSSKNCESCINSSVSLNKTTYSCVDVPQHNTAPNILNASFVSARTNPSDEDLHKSLNNLRLGGFRAPPYGLLKRPKPVLSPPKLPTVNSWVAGGFWTNSYGVVMPMAQGSNLSRSSSQSSGFGSQSNEFVPVKSNFFGEFDRFSSTGEFSRVSPTNFGFAPPEFRKNPNFYNNQIHRVGSPGFKLNESYHRVENWSDKINLQAMENFRDLNLHN